GPKQPKAKRRTIADVEKIKQAIEAAQERCRSVVEQTKSDTTRGTTGTGENEWFTPAEYVELARQVLGGIDLDPASHVEAQQTVRAKRYFTKADDGLSRKWPGRVWLNPPYARTLIPQFIKKLLAEVKAGRTVAALVLTHNYTSSEWFQDLAAHADAIC